MIETWKTKQNMGHKVGVIYMDLSKAFGSLNYKLLIAKLNVMDQTNMQLNFLEVTSQIAGSAVK